MHVPALPPWHLASLYLPAYLLLVSPLLAPLPGSRVFITYYFSASVLSGLCGSCCASPSTWNAHRSSDCTSLPLGLFYCVLLPTGLAVRFKQCTLGWHRGQRYLSSHGDRLHNPKEITTAAAQNLLSGASSVTTAPLTTGGFSASSVTTAPLTTGGFSGCGQRVKKTLSRIIGGSDAKNGDWPWHASLQLRGHHKCGAALISDAWLVTAAHCFDWPKTEGVDVWTVRLGTVHLDTGDELKLSEIIKYPGYTSNTHDNDIALLRLSQPIRFTRDIRPVCLPKASRIIPAGSLCFITGWGAREPNGDPAPILRYGQVKIIATEKCQDSTEYRNRVTSSMLCAGFMDGSVDACQGDSGGPLVAANSTEPWYLVGIVSWGEGCGKPNLPGIYSRITALRVWIGNNTGL